MSGFFDDGGFFPRRPPPSAPPVTSFGWATDGLTELPALTFDPLVSTGITEAQMRAGLSVVGGVLRADLGAMLTAGASAGARGVMWLTERTLKAPTYLFGDGEIVTASGGGSGKSGFVGFVLGHYDAPGDATPSPPTATTGTTTGALAILTWGINTGGARGGRAYAWASAPTGISANQPFYAGWVNIAPLDIGNSIQARTGISYPPAGNNAVSAGRAAAGSGAPLVAAHRLRVGVIVEIVEAGCVLVATIKTLDAQWRPA